MTIQEQRKPRTSPVWMTLALFLLLMNPAWAAHDEPGTDRPKIGLALSGGGARGAAHIGVLKVLEELRVPIDYIAGTSMGSIVGALYASGMTTEEIEEVLTGIDWDYTFQDDPPRADRSFRRKRDDDLYLVKAKPGFNDGKIEFPSGLIQGQKVDLLFQSLTLPVAEVNNFDDLSIPYRAVATDIVTGKAVVLGTGSLSQAMRASMSIPGGFAAVEIEGKLLVDGGVADNLPIDVVREMGADVVIAVDISTPLMTREEIQGALAITGQLTGILTRRNTEEQIATLTEKDVLIVPDLGDITTSSFSQAGEAIPKGVVAAELKRAELARYSISETGYAEHMRGREKRDTEPPVIEFVRLDNQSGIGDDVFAKYLSVRPGKPLDVPRLEAEIGRIYGLELFESVRYDLVEEEGKTGIVIHAREKSWGPNYVQFGIALAGTEEGDNSYNLALAYRMTALNRLGGELLVGGQAGEEPGILVDYFQYLDVDSRYFIEPQLEWAKGNFSVYDKDGDALSEYRVTRYVGEIAAGREFGAWGEARLGYRLYTGYAKIRVGDPATPKESFQGGEVFVRLSQDKLDDMNFPRRGTLVSVEWTGSRKTLAAYDDFDQVTAKGYGAFSWGKNTLILGARYETTLDDDAPIQNRFRTGGFLNLSGYNVSELSGQHSGMVETIYYRRMNDFNLLPVYLGGSLESGNVWEDKADVGKDPLFAGSLFLGVDTPFGPMYFAYGMAEAGRNALYFYLGNTFRD